MMELHKLPIKIVYVEDDEKIRHMTASYLDRHVASLYTASNGEEALELFAKVSPDVVVTDIEIEGTNGIQFIRSLKRMRPDLPIFVTTTLHDTVTLTEAIREGITHYHYKHSDPTKLLHSIRDYFKFTRNGFLTMELDEKGVVTGISDTFAQYLKFEKEELVGSAVETFVRLVENGKTPCSGESALSLKGEDLQAVFIRKDGSERLLGGSGERKILEGGDVRYRTQWYPIGCLIRSHREITRQLAKECYLKSLLQLHAYISQEAIRADDPAHFLQEIVDRLPQVDPKLSGFVLRLVRGRLQFVTATSGSVAGELFSEPLLLDDEISERAHLPCYLAARHGRMVFLDDIAPLAEGAFKHALQEQGIETVVSIPMRHTESNETDILTLTFGRKHSFDKEELDLWQNIANTMAFGLVSIRLRLDRDDLIRRLDVMAHTDSLTGVLNRYRGVELIEHEIYRAERYGHPFSIIFFDIDNFKTINDTHGHEVGDRVLVEVARVVGGSLRRTDTLIRWGGEEFIILLPETSLHEAVHLGNKLRQSIENRSNSLPLPVTASFGITEWRHGQNLDTLISRADAKMYEAKRSGRNRICY